MTSLNYMEAKRLSYAKGPTDKPELLEKTIPQVQAKTTKEYPDKEFLVSSITGQRLTFHEFDKLTDTIAKGLMALGINQQDRVGIAMSNCIEWIAVYFACFKIGAYPVNIVPTLKPKNLEYMITQPDLAVLIADKRNVELTQNVIQRSITTIFVGEGEPDINDFQNFFFWEELFAEAENIEDDELQACQEAIPTRDTAGLCYTSGTTGNPKGVMLTHSGLVNNCNILAHLFSYNVSDIMPLTVPMFHFFGWVLSLLCMQQGMKLVLPTSYLRPASILECLDKEACTTMGSAPQIYNFFVNFPNLTDYDLAALKHCFAGSDVVSMEIIELMFNKLNIDTLQNVWGSTELGGGFTITPNEDAKKETMKNIVPVGQVIPHSEIEIVDPETGETVPRGEEGEIWGRGPSTFEGYWRKEKETNETLTKDDWVKTGDVGFMDQEGFIHFVGRVDEMFKKGAEKVAPAPIEQVLRQHPEIVDAGVVGVRDPRYGLEVAAFVQLKEDFFNEMRRHQEKTQQLHQEIQKLARKKLEPFKIPRVVIFTSKLYRTATGKIRHFKLKQKVEEMAQEVKEGAYIIDLLNQERKKA